MAEGMEGVGMRSRRHGGDGGAASLRPALARSRERPRGVRPPSPPFPHPPPSSAAPSDPRPPPPLFPLWSLGLPPWAREGGREEGGASPRIVARHVPCPTIFLL